MRMTCLSSLALAFLPTLSAADVPKVVTDIPAIQSLVQQVMGDLGTASVLLDKGANEHSYQMKPSQARALERADLVVWVGPELTPWLDRALDAAGPKAARLGLLDAPGTHRQDYAPGAVDDDDDDGHDHGADTHAADGHAEEGHSHDGTDPHAWLDPANAALWLGLIAQDLSRLDPDHAARYAANAAVAQTQITALDAEIKAEFAPVAGRPFVVFHAAYGYFAAHYGLNIAGAVALGDATDAGAAHLSELRAGLVQDNVVCAFPEPQHDPRPINRLVEGTGVRVGGALDPSGSSLDYGAGLYEALIRDLADTIRGCLAKG